MDKINLFWFRRDLRVNDNHGFYNALISKYPTQPIFIFDTEITDELELDDPRISFIYDLITTVNESLNFQGGSLLIRKGNPKDIFQQLIQEFEINAVFTNHDYEPYASKRDLAISSILKSHNIEFYSFKDQVIFEKSEVVKPNGKPYTVYTPYFKSWIKKLEQEPISCHHSDKILNKVYKVNFKFPPLSELGFVQSKIKVLPLNATNEDLKHYEKYRDFPYIGNTSMASPHLRFGSISIRKLVILARKTNFTFLKELVWREFFMQILFHFPRVIQESFKPRYDKIDWLNNKEAFKKWCDGKTGYPLVDAGMRELNQTGYMHNRVRMVVASFLCKHLLIDWRWGESYFASKLLDFELSSNNGNWQWAAGTGCDAAPYFRIFNPTTQLTKFDKDLLYVRKWIKEFDTEEYPNPIVDHKFARERALSAYKKALSET